MPVKNEKYGAVRLHLGNVGVNKFVRIAVSRFKSPANLAHPSLKEIKTGLPAPKNNTGLEGVAFCRSRNSLFCVNEGKPKQWMEFDLSESSFGRLKQSNKVKGVKDLSGVAFDEAGGRLLILSELSHVVLIIDPETGVIEDQLRVDAPEPEGITIGEKGIIYICGEPNELMVLEPADRLEE